MSALRKKVAGSKYWQSSIIFPRWKPKIICHKVVQHISKKNLWERWSLIPLLDCTPCMSKTNVPLLKHFRNATLQASSEGRCPSSGGELSLTVLQRSVWNPTQIPKPLISCFHHLPRSRYTHSWRIHNIQPETTAVRQCRPVCFWSTMSIFIRGDFFKSVLLEPVIHFLTKKAACLWCC